MTGSSTNIHASVLVLDGHGVIVLGRSGAGKTSLVLELLRHCRMDGTNAALVADDRVDLSVRDNCLIAAVPANLAGLIEVRGSGIHRMAFEPSAALDLAVRLVEPDKAERIAPKGKFEVGLGIGLPTLFLPENEPGASLRAILSHLGLFAPWLLGKIHQ